MLIQTLDNLKIENNSLSNETTNTSELHSLYSKSLEESGLLVSGNFKRKKVESSGKFNDSVWVINRTTLSSYGYLDFRKLEELRFENVSKEQMILIKSWVAKKLLDGKFELNNEYHVANADIKTNESFITIFNHFVDFLCCSKNFSKDFLVLDNGDEIGYFFTELSLKMNPQNVRKVKTAILDYLRFSFIQNHLTDEIYCYELYSEYIKRIELILDDTSGLIKGATYNFDDDDDDSVHLPSSTNILKLNYYIDKFFKDESIDEDVRMYYYPILIWWKITLVLPMRISEITAKTPRQCLSQEDDSYYLTIGRTKERRVKKGALPLVTKFKITKEIYDLIDLYIKKTDEYGDTRTLMSYNAFLYFRRIIGAKYPYTFPSAYLRDDKGMFMPIAINSDIEEITNDTTLDIDDVQLLYNVNGDKRDNGTFTKAVFNNLLNSFYNKIIETYYGDISITERLKGNQTRHLAFSYLVLQGIPKVEIAILGGHSGTESIDSYTYDNDVYIDTQVKVNINKKLAEKKISEETLYNKIFSMPKKCPIPEGECVPTEFNNIYLGYCTASEETACENFTCYKCSHWYCEPTVKNFTTLMEIVKNEIEKDKEELCNDVNLISKLIDKSAIIYSDDKDISLNKDYFQDMQQTGKKIKAGADKIIKAKTELLESMLEKGREYSELEIIDKLRLLNETFNKDTVFIK